MTIPLRGPTKTFLSFLVLMWCCSSSLIAQEAKARAELMGKGETWVGQRINLAVELLVPGFFVGAPFFDLPRVPDVLLLPPSESPVLRTERIDGIDYTVQRHEFLVFARRPGEREIPPFTVRLKFKRNPLDKEALAETVRTASIHITVKSPPGTERLAGLLCARDLKVVETWEPPRSHAKTGDAFTRIITYTATDIPAMAFPPFPAPKIDGLGIYPKDPEVLDRSERGSLRGERRDTITYVCQRPGRFLIPSVQFTWWNLEAKELRTITFPERVLDVASNSAVPPTISQDAQPEPSSVWSMRIGFLLGLVVIVAAVLIWRTRAFWRQAIRPFRPGHLVPLNPVSDQPPRKKAQSILKQ
ncbi:MAG: BatD family protein [Chthoniobacterales bacterium]